MCLTPAEKTRLSTEKNIRNLIFKGYTVTFSISDNAIEVLGIYKQNLTRFS